MGLKVCCYVQVPGTAVSLSLCENADFLSLFESANSTALCAGRWYCDQITETADLHRSLGAPWECRFYIIVTRSLGLYILLTVCRSLGVQILDWIDTGLSAIGFVANLAALIAFLRNGDGFGYPIK